MQAPHASEAPSAPAAIAARLRVLRESLGLSQQKFADLLGYKREQVISVEYGKAKPSPEMQAAAIQKAHADPVWLATGVGAMFQKRALSFEDTIELTRQAAMEVQALDVPDEMRRTAQDWLIAIRSRNAQRVRELVALQSAHADATAALATQRAAGKVDVQVLETALELIDAAMLAQGITVTRGKRASLISAVYEMCAREPPPADLVKTLVRLAG